MFASRVIQMDGKLERTRLAAKSDSDAGLSCILELDVDVDQQRHSQV